MDAVKLFHGLAEAMYLSLGQGLIIYLLAKLIIFLLPWMGSAFRYRLLYMSTALIFILFAGRMTLAIMVQAGSQATDAPLMTASELRKHFSLKAIVHQYALIIGILYFTGILIQMVLLLVSLLKIRMLKSRKDLHINYLWQMRLESLQKVLSIKKKVVLRFGERITGPFTTGWLKPVIYFPLAALNNLSTEQVEAILIHELAHIKRNDYLWNLLQRVMEIVLFFNPVTWVLSSEIKKEREFCCDDMVLSKTDETVMYAKALFLLERDRKGSSLIMAATGPQKQSLLDRIKRITDMETTTSNGIPKMIAFTGILVFILFLGWTKQSEALNQKHRQHLNINTKGFSSSVPATSPVVKHLISGISDTVPPPPPPSSAVPPVPPAAPALPSEPVPPVPPAAPAAPHAPSGNRTVLINGKDTVIMDASAVGSYFDSPEWNQQIEKIKSMGDEIKKHFDSPEWKQQVEEIKKRGLELSAQFNSPEWKEKMKNLQINAAEMQKKFDSPEWKAKQQQIAQRAEELAKKFESAEWKSKMKDIEKHTAELQSKFDSPEWKKKMQDLQDRALEIQKKTLKELNKETEKQKPVE